MIKFKFFALLAMIAILPCTDICAQQNVQYTQFMYSKLWMNPAYAGSEDVGRIQAITRNQWLGIEGAPKSQSVNFLTPTFGNKVGLGFSLNHDKLGPTNSWFFNLSYAYRIKTPKGKLSLGVQGNITTYAIDYQRLRTLEQADGVIPDEREQLIIPNFGVGLYYNTDKYFIGLSIPMIVEGHLTFENSNSGFLSRQATHAYFMAGLVHTISEQIQGKPSILLKKVTNAPFDFDVNYSLIFSKKLWTGVAYRFGGDEVNGVGESVDMFVHYQLTNNLRIGAAYGFTLSQLRSVNDGTVEFMAQMCFNQKADNLTNPRFF